MGDVVPSRQQCGVNGVPFIHGGFMGPDPPSNRTSVGSLSFSHDGQAQPVYGGLVVAPRTSQRFQCTRGCLGHSPSGLGLHSFLHSALYLFSSLDTGPPQTVSDQCEKGTLAERSLIRLNFYLSLPTTGPTTKGFTNKF